MIKKFLFWLWFIPLLLILLNVFSFFLDDYSHDFSLTQKYRPFYHLYNWNLPGHAIADFDSDGKTDEVTFTGCTFLSAAQKRLPVSIRTCTEANMIVDPTISKNSAGQQLPFGDPSFLAQNKSGMWQYYAYGFTGFHVYELGKDGIFRPVSPTLYDVIDYVWYMPTHILLIVLPI